MSKWRQIREWRKTHPREDKPPPEAIPPLLPTLVKAIPESPKWLHEVKWDGYRIGVHLNQGQARVYTRNLFDWTERFPSITQAVEGLDAEEAFIDGEAVVLDDEGLSSFSRIQVALGTGGRTGDIVFVAFDLLKLNGKHLRDWPLRERRAALITLLDGELPENILFSEEIEGSAEQIFRHACQHGIEGVVSKLRESPYRSGRRREWVKTKCVLSDEFIAIGYVPGKGFGGLGKIIVASANDGKLIHAGGVGTGFNSKTGPDVRKRLDAIRTKTPPIKGLKEKGAIWVRPEIVVEIEYRGWTEAEQHLRHPSFKGIREDRTAAEFGIDQQRKSRP